MTISTSNSKEQGSRQAIDATWLNARIRELVERGELAHAYKLADSALIDEYPDRMRRAGIVIEILDGSIHFEDSPQDTDGLLLIDDSGQALHSEAVVAENNKETRLDKRLEHQGQNVFLSGLEGLESESKKAATLSNKISFLYLNLIQRHNARALWQACSDYYREYGEPLFDEGGDLINVEEEDGKFVPIPGEVIDAAYEDGYGTPDMQEKWWRGRGFTGDDEKLDELIERFSWKPMFENIGYQDVNEQSSQTLPDNMIAPETYDGENALQDFLETEGTDKAARYGWLNPKGEFFEVPWGKHTGWAREYCEENGIEATFLEEGDALVERGWILVHNPLCGVGKCTMNRDIPPTPNQRKFISRYYDEFNLSMPKKAVQEGWYDELPGFFDLM